MITDHRKNLNILPNISSLTWARWLQSTKMWHTVRIHWRCSHRGGGSFLKMYEWVKCVWPMRAQQYNFILPAPPVGLPISQDWLDTMKLVHDRTIPIILPSGKEIWVDTMFKIIIWYTNLGTRQLQGRLGSWICLFIALNASMAGYPTKNNVFFGNI